MTPPEGCHRYRDQIGALVLGKLDGGQLEAMRAHLDGCLYCQAEMGVLEPVVTALADADPDRIEEDARPPGDLEESTLAPVLEEIYRPRSRGRRSPWSTLAAAAVCVLAMGLAGFAWLLEPAVAMVEPLKFSVEPGMKVEGYLSEHAWGTEIELVVSSGLREGQTYVVTLVSEDGERVNAGTFIGAGDKPVRGTFNAALSREEAVRLEASTPGGEPVFFAELPEEPRDLVHNWPLLGVLPWADPDLIESMGSSSPEGPGEPTQQEPKDPGFWGGTPPPEVSPPEGDPPEGSSPPGGGKPGAAPEGSEPGGLDKPPPSSVPPSSPASPAPVPDPCELPPDEQPPTCPQYDPQL